MSLIWPTCVLIPWVLELSWRLCNAVVFMKWIQRGLEISRWLKHRITKSSPSRLTLLICGASYTCYRAVIPSGDIHPCSKVIGFFCKSQKMVFIFSVQIWNFSCCMTMSFAFIVENMRVCYSFTPVWTFKMKNALPKRHNTDINMEIFSFCTT